MDQLQAQLTLKLGQKPSLQDILDICIQLGYENTNVLAERLKEIPILTDEKIQRIIKRKKDTSDVPYDVNAELLS